MREKRVTGTFYNKLLITVCLCKKGVTFYNNNVEKCDNNYGTRFINSGIVTDIDLNSEAALNQ